jgi:D-arginine dehydrogenase
MIHDFIVIGGGIAGTSAGAQLSALGSVLLLEGEDALAYHASGRSAALYEASYGHPVTIALNLASRAEHESLDGGVLSPRGLLLLGGPGEEEVAEADIRAMGLEPLSPTEAAARVPILDTSHVTRAAWHEDALDIDTDRMVHHFARTIRQAGGEVHVGARVNGISRDRDLWRVAYRHEVRQGRVLVNAAGAWADRIAAMAGIAPIGLRPLRRSIARMPAPGGHDVRGWPLLFGAGERWYAKPDAGAWIVSPAEEDPVEAPHDAWPETWCWPKGSRATSRS